MPKTWVEQLGPDTIARFEKAAVQRLEEGEFLSERYGLTAVYLYGYAAEMILKAAYFRNLGYNRLVEIDRGARNRAHASAQANGFMSRDPHDILGWARLLNWYKETLYPSAYEPKLSGKIVTNALTVYENWRPQMRYRNIFPAPEKVFAVRAAAAWMIDNYHKM